MFASITNKLQNTSFVKLARKIAAASVVTPFYEIVDTKKANLMIASEPTLFTIVGVDPTDATKSHVQCSTAGLAAVQALPAETEAPAKAAPIKYERRQLDAVPDVQRGGNKGDSYPFAELAAPTPKLDASGQPVVIDGVAQMTYDSFFVPATDARPNPAKALNSTVSSATKRYDTATDKRVFTVRKSVDTTGKVDGALVIRLS